MDAIQIPLSTIVAVATPLLGVIATIGKLLWTALEKCREQCRADLAAKDEEIRELRRAWYRDLLRLSGRSSPPPSQ
jgi:hypothetical protein